MIKIVLYCTQTGGDLDGVGVSGVGVCWLKKGLRGLPQMERQAALQYRLKTPSISSSVQGALRCTDAFTICSVNNIRHETLRMRFCRISSRDHLFVGGL
jgi:hypothetical protein